MAPAPDALTHLALSRGTLDRAAYRRSDPELMPRLLGDPTTRVVVITPDARMEVGEATPGAGPLVISYRAPQPADAERLALFLGEQRVLGEERVLGEGPPAGDAADHGTTSYVAVVGEAPGDDDPASEQWQNLRTAGLDLG
ncbi:MAG: hypothetical protein ABI243_10370, partial [Lapillicoccus sp.]